jgi:hypothetical protein
VSSVDGDKIALSQTNPIITPVLTGLFALMGVVLGHYMQYRIEKRKIEVKEKERLVQLVNLQSLVVII